MLSVYYRYTEHSTVGWDMYHYEMLSVYYRYTEHSTVGWDMYHYEMLSVCYRYTEHSTVGCDMYHYEMLSVCYRYTEHSTVGLAQQWDQLDQLGMRMQHNLEQQIQAWYVTSISPSHTPHMVRSRPGMLHPSHPHTHHTWSDPGLVCYIHLTLTHTTHGQIQAWYVTSISLSHTPHMVRPRPG